MKAKYIFIIILLSVMTGYNSLLSQDNNSVATDLSMDSKRSKNLINRFNTLRASEGLPSIEHDTVLANIGKILLTDETKTFRKSEGVYDEDSVRLLLLYEKGIIDYQYEIKEISDKDTAAVFKDFLLADRWNHIHAGYYKTKDKHILLKTKSYLKYVCGGASQRLEVTVAEGTNPPMRKTKSHIDSIINYFKILTPGQYYYQFCKKIPLSNEKEKNIKKKKIKITPGISMYGEYDFVVKASEPETYMFLIISNENNERIVVIR